MDTQSDQAAGKPEDPLRALSLDTLESEIAALAAGLTASQARWLRLLGEFDRREGWASWGMRSCADWVAWRCATSTRSAREHVQIARALRELPRIRAEFEAGPLSYSKVRALCRIATPETETDLIELASELTASQLESSVRSLIRVDEINQREREARRRVSWFWEDDGCLELRATLPPEEGALLLAAIDSARDELFSLDDHSDAEEFAEAPGESGTAVPRGESGDEVRVPPPTNADALMFVCEKAVKRSAAGPPSSADRNQVVIHLDLAEDHAHVESGPSLHPATARRFGCDAAAVAQIERGGRTLSVGRRTRVVPPQIRRALAGRDPACRFPGCNSRRGLDAHHVRHWQDGGETSLENLVLVCRRHHRALHEGGCSVEQRPGGGGLAFRDPHDRLLERSPLPPAPPLTGSRRSEANGQVPGPLATGTGERAERALLVDALIAIRRRGRERRRGGESQPGGGSSAAT